MPENKNIGIITEQGFAAGNGLGFNPVDEKDLKHINEESENKNDSQNK